MFSGLTVHTHTHTRTHTYIHTHTQCKNRKYCLLVKNKIVALLIIYNFFFYFKDIPADISAKDFKGILQESFDVGDLDVQRRGTCFSYTWTVTWLSKGGNQPELSVDGTGLSGNHATIYVKTIENGNLFLGPVPGEFLRMPSIEPEVGIHLNLIWHRYVASFQKRKAVKTVDISMFDNVTRL